MFWILSVKNRNQLVYVWDLTDKSDRSLKRDMSCLIELALIQLHRFRIYQGFLQINMLNIFKGTSEGAGISLKHIYTHEIMHNILDNLQLLNVNKTYIYSWSYTQNPLWTVWEFDRHA